MPNQSEQRATVHNFAFIISKPTSNLQGKEAKQNQEMKTSFAVIKFWEKFFARVFDKGELLSPKAQQPWPHYMQKCVYNPPIIYNNGLLAVASYRAFQYMLKRYGERKRGGGRGRRYI